MKLNLTWLMLPLALCTTITMAADDDLMARITAIEDRLAIEKIVMGDYPRALDLGKMDDYAALWAEDGILIIPSLATLRGPAMIEKFLSTPGIFADDYDPDAPPPPAPPFVPYRVPHMVGSLSYEVNGDTAVGSSYWLETVLIDGEPEVAGSGHYVDELAKINGVWKFTKRTIVRDIPVMPPEVAAYAPEIEL